jgi:hypothetical protein
LNKNHVEKNIQKQRVQNFKTIAMNYGEKSTQHENCQAQTAAISLLMAMNTLEIDRIIDRVDKLSRLK